MSRLAMTYYFSTGDVKMVEPKKPELKVEQINQEAIAGHNAVLELQVQGYPKPFCTWSHDGKPIEQDGKYK